MERPLEHPRAQGCPSASINDPVYLVTGEVPVMDSSPALVAPESDAQLVAGTSAPAAEEEVVPLLAQPSDAEPVPNEEAAVPVAPAE